MRDKPVGTQTASQQSMAVRAGRVMALLVVGATLWIGWPWTLAAVDATRLGATVFYYLLIVPGLVILFLATVALRHTGPLGVIRELGLLPF